MSNKIKIIDYKMEIQEKRKIIVQKIDKMPEGDLSELYDFIQSLENDKSEIKPILPVKRFWQKIEIKKKNRKHGKIYSSFFNQFFRLKDRKWQYIN